VYVCVVRARARVCVRVCVCIHCVCQCAYNIYIYANMQAYTSCGWMYDSHPPNKYTSTGVQIHANIWLTFVCQYTNIYVWAHTYKYELMWVFAYTYFCRYTYPWAFTWGTCHSHPPLFAFANESCRAHTLYAQ